MRLTLSKFLLVLCCLSVVGNVAADAGFLKPYRLVYDAKFNFFLPIQGTAIRELQKQPDGHWVLSNTVDLSILKIQESSLFSWQQQQPKPLLYRFEQQGVGASRNEKLRFDWDKLKAHHKTNKPPGSFDIAEHTLDNLTHQLKIRQDLMAGSDKRLVYSVADKRKIKRYSFDIVRSVVLDTPVGKLNTLQIRRDRGEESDRETTLWLAKDWDYLIVKIHQNEKGKDYEIVMLEGELDNRPIKGL